MSDKRNCENCLWYDKCGQGCACEYFEAASDTDNIEGLTNAYTRDLRERHGYYVEQIEEQDS
jgi:hypothetical protein